MSIVTKQGDRGRTGLVGGVRVSKASLRVEAYGAVDELNSQVGFARAICPNASVAALLKDIQRELFAVGGALATPTPRDGAEPAVTAAMVERLGAEVSRVEAVEGVLKIDEYNFFLFNLETISFCIIFNCRLCSPRLLECTHADGWHG